ncbi:hypothetical protein HDU89_004510 [Geranomyces variabilis]|nr:hypothetical protein HDU89_004510 [Geranomyces variabilis]
MSNTSSGPASVPTSFEPERCQLPWDDTWIEVFTDAAAGRLDFVTTFPYPMDSDYPTLREAIDTGLPLLNIVPTLHLDLGGVLDSCGLGGVPDFKKLATSLNIIIEVSIISFWSRLLKIDSQPAGAGEIGKLLQCIDRYAPRSCRENHPCARQRADVKTLKLVMALVKLNEPSSGSSTRMCWAPLLPTNERVGYEGGTLQLNLPTKMPATSMSENLEICLAALHRDVKVNTDFLLTTCVHVRTPLTVVSRARWELDCTRFFRPSSNRFGSIDLERSAPAYIALKQNATWPWVGNANNCRLAFPVFCSDVFDLGDGLCRQHVLGMAHLSELESPDLFLKNLALALQSAAAERNCAATMLVFGIPPSSFFDWLIDCGIGQPVKPLETVSPIRDVEVVMALPLNDTPENEGDTIRGAFFGHFMFRLTSGRRCALRLYNELSAGRRKNWLGLWRRVRDSKEVLDFLLEERAQETQKDRTERFWRFLADHGSTEKWRNEARVLGSLELEKYIARALEISAVDSKRASKLWKTLNADPDDVAGCSLAFGNRFRSLLQTAAKDHDDTVGSRAVYKLPIEHVFLDATKGYLYSSNYQRLLRTVDTSYLTSIAKSSQERPVRSFYLLRVVDGEALHVVGFDKYLKDKKLSPIKKIFSVLEGLALIIGRLDAPEGLSDTVIQAVTRSLAPVKHDLAKEWVGSFRLQLKRDNVFPSRMLLEEPIEKLLQGLVAAFKSHESVSSGGHEKLVPVEERLQAGLNSLHNCVLATFNSYELTIGQWIQFLDDFSYAKDTPLSELPPGVSAFVALARQGVDSQLADSPDGVNIYFSQIRTKAFLPVVKLIFVVLPSNEIIVAEESIFSGGTRPSHSQLAHGSAVKAAGELVFRRQGDPDGGWYLDEINNKSGHYAPPPTTLDFALTLVRAQLPRCVSTVEAQIRGSQLLPGHAVS